MMNPDVFISAEFWSSSKPLVMNPGLPLTEIAELQDWVDGNVYCKNCLLFSTSGSSGRRKWIVLSRAALLFSAQAVVRRFEITKNDVLGLALPIYHVGGFGLIARAWASGAKLAHFCEKWSAGKFTEWAEENSVTITSLVPTQVSDLVAQKCRASKKMRAVVVGGGRFDPKLQRQAQALGWPVLASYGMTETASQIATELPSEKGMKLFDNWETKVATDGRLSLRGSPLLSGMVQKSAGTYHFFDPKRDGWYETSDLVKVDGGMIKITARADRQVKILGELVNLVSIESFFRVKLGCEVRIKAEADERAGASLHLSAENCESVQLDIAVADFHHQCQGFERLAAWKSVGKLKRSALGKIIG